MVSGPGTRLSQGHRPVARFGVPVIGTDRVSGYRPELVRDRFSHPDANRPQPLRSNLGRELGRKLAQFTSQLPRIGRRGDDVNVTSAFLLDLGETVGEPLSQRTSTALDRLSRKVDVAKKVWVSYDADWAKPVDKTAIRLDAWPALVISFLYSADTMLRRDANAKGRSLQLVNSACNALDLYRDAPGNDHVDILHDYCVRTLEVVVAQ